MWKKKNYILFIKIRKFIFKLASQPTQSQNMVNAINGGGGQSFDHMYGGPSNPLQNAQMPMGDGLMAANEVLGGSFGTAF